MKLTMVSITYRGVTLTIFIKLTYVNGKAIINQSIVDHELAKLGCFYGSTYSIG